MNHYEILGVSENTSKEEIQKAYESRLNKIKAEVTNERRTKLFVGALNSAYEALMKDIKEKEAIINSLNNDDEDKFKTVVMDSKEVEREIKKQQAVYEEREENSSKKNTKSKGSSGSSSKNRAKKPSSNDNEKNKKDKQEDNEKKKKNRPEKVVVESDNNGGKSVLNLLMLPLKIIALPIIVVLSILIFICKTINLISWIASKVIIVGAIGLGAIHLYQIHLGQVPDKNLLIVAAIAIIVSFFLPYILRIIPKTLGAINDMLKSFVFS